MLVDAKNRGFDYGHRVKLGMYAIQSEVSLQCFGDEQAFERLEEER